MKTMPNTSKRSPDVIPCKQMLVRECRRFETPQQSEADVLQNGMLDIQAEWDEHFLWPIAWRVTKIELENEQGGSSLEVEAILVDVYNGLMESEWVSTTEPSPDRPLAAA